MKSSDLSSTKGPWVLYEEIPRDQPCDLCQFDGQGEDRQLLPADVVAEYLKDGKPAAQDDPASAWPTASTFGHCDDYQTLFHDDRINWTEMLDLFEATKRDKALIDTALADAQRQEEADKKHVAEAKEKLAKYARECDIVAAHQKRSRNNWRRLRRRLPSCLQPTRPWPTNSPGANGMPCVTSTSGFATWRNRTPGENSGVGFYDRDYYREERPGFTFRAPQTIVSALIVVNVAIWLIDGLFMAKTPADGRWLSDHMAVHVDCSAQPRATARQPRSPHTSPRRHAHPAMAVVAVSHVRLRPLRPV